MRRIFDLARGIKPIVGAPFTFRTLHPPDGRFGPERTEHTLDRQITITLPAISGMDHHEAPTRWVDLCLTTIVPRR